MAIFLLDTSMFSFMMKEHAIVRAQLASLPIEDRVVVCTIVRGEVMYGLEKMPQGKKRRALELKATNLFSAISCESVPEAAANHYAHIKREVERKGTPLDENDLWIAATALALDAVLVTADSDFERVDKLQVEDWTR